MAKKKLNKWQQWITSYGTQRLAKKLGCHRQTVKRWLLHGDLPNDNYKRTIVYLSGKVLTFDDFYTS